MTEEMFLRLLVTTSAFCFYPVRAFSHKFVGFCASMCVTFTPFVTRNILRQLGCGGGWFQAKRQIKRFAFKANFSNERCVEVEFEFLVFENGPSYSSV